MNNLDDEKLDENVTYLYFHNIENIHYYTYVCQTYMETRNSYHI